MKKTLEGWNEEGMKERGKKGIRQKVKARIKCYDKVKEGMREEKRLKDRRGKLKK